MVKPEFMHSIKIIRSMSKCINILPILTATITKIQWMMIYQNTFQWVRVKIYEQCGLKLYSHNCKGVTKRPKLSADRCNV